MTLDQAGQTPWCSLAVVSQQMWRWAAHLERHAEWNCKWMSDGCGFEDPVSRVVSFSPKYHDRQIGLVVEWRTGAAGLVLAVACRTRFYFILACGFLLPIKHLKICVFKRFYWSSCKVALVTVESPGDRTSAYRMYILSQIGIFLYWQPRYKEKRTFLCV